jgi:hypothetical protein
MAKYGLLVAGGMAEKKKVVLSTKVSVAREGSPSVRTTIPFVIAQALALEDGSYMDWVFEPEGDSFSVSVRKNSTK